VGLIEERINKWVETADRHWLGSVFRDSCFSYHC